MADSYTTQNSVTGDDIAIYLTRIWQELLDVKSISPDQNYFDLGGTSLQAVSLFAQIEQLFKVKLPLATLYEAPTIEQLTRLLRAEASATSQSKPRWSSLVKFSAKGSKPPLFLMHSHGGNILEYHALANRLGQDRPLYALQARGLDDNFFEEARIEDMTSYYLKEIQSVQAHGPYYLGGFCFGGFLALEAAQQLRAQNEDVALVIMINASTKAYLYPPNMTRFHRILYGMAYRLTFEFQNLWRRPLKKKFAHLLARARRVKEVSHVRTKMLVEKLLVKHGNVRKHSLVHHLECLAMANDHAWSTYAPKSYDGKVLLLYAGRQPLGIPTNPALGWDRLLTGEFEVREVPGFPQNMLYGPSVETLASLMINALQECESMKAEGDVSDKGNR